MPQLKPLNKGDKYGRLTILGESKIERDIDKALYTKSQTIKDLD